MPKRTATTQWRQTRAKVLETYPTCYWCGRAPSTEADHLLEHDAGGDDHESNLVGACKQCNGTRGNRYRAQRDAARIAARDHATQQHQHVLLRDEPLPPTPSNSLSCGDQPELASIGLNRPAAAPTGRERPRLESPRLGGLSWGPAVASWAAKHLGVELMPWQVYALSGQLEYRSADSDLGWRFVRRESLVSTARQCGKSIALQALIGWWLTQYALEVGRPVQVLSVANQLDRAEAIFTNLAPKLIEDFGGKALQAIGRKTLRLANGSVWDVRAASPRLHGGSYDLIVVDELWNISAETLDEALRPSQIAKENPLLSMWSTAGDQGSAAMISYRERALADLDRGELTPNYFAEWSLPGGVNPKDESYWGYPNPALGITITIEALRAAATKDGFIRAHLNQWVTSRGAWLETGLWEELVEMPSMPAGGVLAVDSSLDESRYVGVRAALKDDRVIVDIEFAVESEEQMWAEVQRVMADKQVILAITPGLATHLPTTYNRRFEQVGYAELIKYTALVRSMIAERRVWHRGSEILTEHVTRAVSTKAQNGLVLSSQKSPGPIEAARCMVWAVGMASKAQNRQRPMLVVAG